MREDCYLKVGWSCGVNIDEIVTFSEVVLRIEGGWDSGIERGVCFLNF